MRELSSRSRAITTSLAPLLALATFSCTDQDVSIKASGVYLMTSEGSEGDVQVCSGPSSTQGDEIISSTTGVFNLRDVATFGQDIGDTSRQGYNGGLRNTRPNTYSLGMIIQNMLIGNDRAGGLSLRTNTNDIYITGANIRFSFPSTEKELERNFTQFLPIASTSFSSVPLTSTQQDVLELRGLVEAELANIPEPAKSQTSVTAFVRVQLFGETLSGASVESNIFTYPIDFCLACASTSTPACVGI